MSNLRELTKEAHQKAERQEFVRIMFSGEMNPELYAAFLYNQFPQYEILEAFASRFNLLSDIPEVERAKRIYADFQELWNMPNAVPTLCPVVEEYIAYIKGISNDPDKIMAHIYVRHMGDLSGGQLIAKKVPGSGTMYQFDGDIDDIKNKIRAKLNDEMAAEAKVCFNFATRMFEQMMDFVQYVDEKGDTLEKGPKL